MQLQIGAAPFVHSGTTVVAQVLIGGSQPTQDYRLQLYTPPYLTGSPSRPVIQSITSVAPAYGSALTIAFGWTNGAGTISRAVIVRQGGISGSMHFDQRQVQLCC